MHESLYPTTHSEWGVSVCGLPGVVLQQGSTLASIHTQPLCCTMVHHRGCMAADMPLYLIRQPASPLHKPVLCTRGYHAPCKRVTNVASTAPCCSHNPATHQHIGCCRSVNSNLAQSGNWCTAAGPGHHWHLVCTCNRMGLHRGNLYTQRQAADMTQCTVC